MPFALLFIGILLIVVGFQNTYKQFAAEVIKDFSGPGNFFYWMISIGLVGSLGYAESLKTFSRVFMALIIVAMILNNRGFFSKFSEAVETGSSTPVRAIGGALPSAGGAKKKKGGIGGFLGGALDAVTGGGLNFGPLDVASSVLPPPLNIGASVLSNF